MPLGANTLQPLYNTTAWAQSKTLANEAAV